MQLRVPSRRMQFKGTLSRNPRTKMHYAGQIESGKSRRTNRNTFISRVAFTMPKSLWLILDRREIKRSRFLYLSFSLFTRFVSPYTRFLLSSPFPFYWSSRNFIPFHSQLTFCTFLILSFSFLHILPFLVFQFFLYSM